MLVGFIFHERRCYRASLSVHADLWEPTTSSVLERTDSARNKLNARPEIQGWLVNAGGIVI